MQEKQTTIWDILQVAIPILLFVHSLSFLVRFRQLNELQ